MRSNAADFVDVDCRRGFQVLSEGKRYCKTEAKKKRELVEISVTCVYIPVTLFAQGRYELVEMENSNEELALANLLPPPTKHTRKTTRLNEECRA